MQPHKSKIQQLMEECFQQQDYITAYECLRIYHQNFEHDTFSQTYEQRLFAADGSNHNGPLVSLISINCSSDTINSYLSSQTYDNLEFIEIIGDDWENDITEAIQSANGTYICFIEEGQQYAKERITALVKFFETHPSLDAVLCTRTFINQDGDLIGHVDIAYQEALEQKLLSGKLLLQTSIQDQVNLYGNLSTIMLSAKYARLCTFSFTQIPNTLRSTALLFQLLMHAHIGYLYTPYVATYLQPFTDDTQIRQDFEAYIHTLSSELTITCNTVSDSRPISRNITFFYTDKGEYYNIKPIADEAQKRGYQVHFTTNRLESAEIGVYSQHICHPENARFSLILLHDLSQGQTHWPNLWEVERWNHFDIGILPGASWRNRWLECSGFYYSHPRCGVFELGYPKSDLTHSSALKQRADELRKSMNLKYDYSILYAPSWENDGKEDDFIQALQSMNVNLLVKQAHWTGTSVPFLENVQKMRQLHEGKFENLYYIEPEESIMTALELCDIVVSEESSVMTEALMFQKPSIAVMDWLIPDTKPSRYACVPFDYVFKCKKTQLRTTVEHIMSDAHAYRQFLSKSTQMFSNVGSSSKDIMDAVDYYTDKSHSGNTDCSFLNKKLKPQYQYCSLWN